MLDATLYESFVKRYNKKKMCLLQRHRTLNARLLKFEKGVDLLSMGYLGDFIVNNYKRL